MTRANLGEFFFDGLRIFFSWGRLSTIITGMKSKISVDEF